MKVPIVCFYVNSVMSYTHVHVIPFREIPNELQSVARGGEVNVNIEDKRTELYVQPKPKLVAFSGAGHKLGK